ncbi:hypothetical protein F442_13569 [Phytophthora nicotianae P10297]|uniref:Carboxylesterase type B domain-containing protein n=2 Tax=Phytophthora nicotianae TaxID=4792 RepID=V9EP59_PHYNI|nr:hypothetical protein F443_13718 [Phytophthora nicotianae P1569]ETP38933.1 hypothetical protein F442_13569 [Phytophthora nicotianae P10297]
MPTRQLYAMYTKSIERIDEALPASIHLRASTVVHTKEDVLTYLPHSFQNIVLTHALNNETWSAQVALGAASHGADQNYYWYSTYTLNTSSNSSSEAETTDATEAAGVGAVTTAVNATIAVSMQKYLVSFVLTGNPNSVWSEDKIYWPMFNESSVGAQIVLNDTFSVADDSLANAKSLFWNRRYGTEVRDHFESKP